MRLRPFRAAPRSGSGPARRRSTPLCLEPLESRVLPAATVWQGYARDAQHTALSGVASQPFNAIRWQTPVDLAPQYSGNDLFIHYGSPSITSANTVIVPVKTGAGGGFEVEGFRGSDGTLLWSHASDYQLPPSPGWTPSYSPTLTPTGRLYFAGNGGTLYFMDSPDGAGASVTGHFAFYGLGNYLSNPGAYNGTVFINTPLTSDSAGNIYFGFQVTGTNPSGLQSGIARIAPNGTGTWISAAAAANNPSSPAAVKVVDNCAPALSNDGTTLYVAVNNGNDGVANNGYLLALNSTTLAFQGRVLLQDPQSGNLSYLPDDGSASPMVGPNGDVFFGVLENTGSYASKGWMLHFKSDLSPGGLPGLFGWDDTASVVPTSMLPPSEYSGTAPYLIMTKYNNYKDFGLDGINKLAILDPFDPTGTFDPRTGVTGMKQVLTIAGVTPDGPPATAVREWCINTAVVDPATDSVLANSEDGKLYRWNLASNSFTQVITLTPGVGEAYTPTLIGRDGTVYAINNATLFAVGDYLPTTSVTLDGSGNLVVTDTRPGGKDDHLSVQSDTGPNQRFVISDPGAIFNVIPTGATVSADLHTVYLPFTSFPATTPIQFSTLGGNDRLTVDYSLGAFANTIGYDAGTGSNSLALQGGAFQTATETFTTTGPGPSGTLLLDDGTHPAQMITCANPTPVDLMGSTAGNLVLNLPAATQARLEDDGSSGNGLSQIRSISGPAFATTTFRNPGSSLTISTAGSSSLVQLATMDTGFAPATETFIGQAGDTFGLLQAAAIPSTTAITLTTATLNLKGLSPTIGALNGTGTVTSTVANPLATLTVTGGGAFSGTITGASTALSVNGPGKTLTLSGSNTYTGPTNLEGGTLTVNGALDNSGVVHLNTAGVTLNGSGIIRGQVLVAASTSGSPTSVQGLTITVPAGGVGITVQSGATFVPCSGVTINGGGTSSTGVLVQGGGSVKVLNSTISGQHVGIDVNGGTALLQGNNLSSNTAGGGAAGLRVENGGIVDAGQRGAFYGNLTGLGVSGGGNTFLGYTPAYIGSPQDPAVVPQAIRDLNTGGVYGNPGPQLGNKDLPAQNNNYGAGTLMGVENLIYHDLDSSGLGFVAYGTASSTPPHLAGPIHYYARDPAEGTATTGQKSAIRHIQVTFDSFVFLAGSYLVLAKVNGPSGAAAGTVMLVTATSAVYDPVTGHYTLTYSFSGPGTESGGSLEDGNYSLRLVADKIQGGGPGGATLDGNNNGVAQGSPADDVFENFFRLFGDSNGDRKVDSTDSTAFQAAYRSVDGMPNYRNYFDINNDHLIDTPDYYEFLRRMNRKLNADGSLTPLP